MIAEFNANGAGTILYKLEKRIKCNAQKRSVWPSGQILTWSLVTDNEGVVLLFFRRCLVLQEC